MMRILLDYALGFVLLLAGVGLITGTGTPIGIAIGVICGAVGLLLIVGRILAGRQKV